MNTYRVIVSKREVNRSFTGTYFNPFLIKNKSDLPSNTRLITREWTFEAENEAEVLRLYNEAVEAGNEQLIGFELASITLVTTQNPPT